MRTTAVPAAATDRLEYVDILRGFALIGVFGANLLIFSGFVYMTDAQRALLPTARLDQIFHLLEMVFIENKFLGLFAILFGVSFWLFLDRARARGASGRSGLALFYRRLWWLFVIGAVHGWLFWCFDVLRFYALWGLLLPLFLRVSQRTLLRVALFCAVLAPALVIGLRSQFLAPSPANAAFDQLALRAFSALPNCRSMGFRVWSRLEPALYIDHYYWSYDHLCWSTNRPRLEARAAPGLSLRCNFSGRATRESWPGFWKHSCTQCRRPSPASSAMESWRLDPAVGPGSSDWTRAISPTLS